MGGFEGTSDGITVTVARSSAELDEYSASWDDLAVRAPQGLPFLSHAWVSSYFAHLVAPDVKWFCLFAHQRSHLVGVLPVVVERDRTLGIGGATLRVPKDPHVATIDVLIERSLERGVLEALLRSLGEEIPGFHCLHFEKVSGASPATRLPRFSRFGAAVLRTRGRASVVPTEGSFLVYQESLDRKLTKNLRRARKRLNAMEGVSFRTITGARAGDALDRFLVLEASGWKGKAGSAIAMDAGRTSFYRSLVARLAERGWLEWDFLTVGERVIAGSLGIRTGRVLTRWKIAYDEEFSACAPGNLLFESVIRRCFESPEIDEVNLVTDTESQEKWLPGKKPYLEVWFYPSRPLPFAFGFLPRSIAGVLRDVPYVGDVLARLRRAIG